MQTTPQQTQEETIRRNIEAIHRLRVEMDQKRRLDQKVIDEVASFLGTPACIYLHLGLYTAWIVLIAVKYPNGHWEGWLEALSTMASVEAIFLAISVLVNQRRTRASERRNSDLHLQTSLLAEYEISRIAASIDAMARHLGLDSTERAAVREVAQETDPNEILNQISEQESQAPTHLTSDMHTKKTKSD